MSKKEELAYAPLLEQLSQGSLWINCPFACDDSELELVSVASGWTVECLHCSATGPVADTPRLALAAWNERCEPFIPDDAEDRIADLRCGGNGDHKE